MGTDSLADCSACESRSQSITMCPNAAPPVEFSLDSSFSEEAKQRRVGRLSRMVQQFVGQPDIIGMHGGLPPASHFPFTSFSFTTLDPFTTAHSTPQDASAPPTPPATPPPSTAAQAPIEGPANRSGEVVIDAPATVATMQQYNLNFASSAPLRAWLQELMTRMHAPVRPDTAVLLTPGNSLAIDTLFRMLLDPGDVVLVEAFMYSQVYEVSIAPRNIVAAAVDVDEEGMQPASLEAAIRHAIATTGCAPKVLYTVPHAHNPTGCNTSLPRKRAIYALCRQHNIFIVEDDPYIYLQFPETGDDMPGLAVEPGYLSMDTDGRVLRLDTFSKILAPGLRLGWATGSPAVLNHLKGALLGASFGPSGVSQGLVVALLQHWGLDGFEAYLRLLQRVYCGKARTLAAALREHCGDAVTVRWPAGGMFLWASVPMVADFEELMDGMVAHKVVAVPGRYFSPRSADQAFKCNSARMAFSLLSDDQLREGARRFGALLREHAARSAGPSPRPATERSSGEALAAIPSPAS
eukprot:jgi/Ulvmu1/8152/UM040_0049.1